MRHDKVFLGLAVSSGGVLMVLISSVGMTDVPYVWRALLMLGSMAIVSGWRLLFLPPKPDKEPK